MCKATVSEWRRVPARAATWGLGLYLLCNPAPGLGSADGYRVGPADQVRIWALGLDEIGDRTYRVGSDGSVDLPVLGRVKAGGATIEEFRQRLLELLAAQVWQPQVSVELVESASQPVTVLGAVARPGVLQLQGDRTLAEVLSLAGGLRPDAGHTVRIRRSAATAVEVGQDEQWREDGGYWVAEVPVKGLMGPSGRGQSIRMLPQDVVSVTNAEQVYVIGTVVRPGSIQLNERATISALQVLSIAEGLGRSAKPERARILRASSGSPDRQEIPVDLKRIMRGQAPDVSLQAEDILFVPDNTAKRAGVRTLEAMLQAATGIAIWGR